MIRPLSERGRDRRRRQVPRPGSACRCQNQSQAEATTADAAGSGYTSPSSPESKPVSVRPGQTTDIGDLRFVDEPDLEFDDDR